MKKQFFRVKQLADQTFLRAEKSEILNHEELQIADQKVEYLRGAITAIVKKIAPSGPTNDLEKIMKKTMEFQLGTTLLEESRQPKECQLFQYILRESGQIEQQLARDNADHEIKVEELVFAPLQNVLENEFPNVLKHKHALRKYCLDKDSASNRYNATRKETVKEDLEEADNKVEQSRDVLAMEMFNILSKENEFSEYILQLLKLQRGYHESALKNLETVIPQLEKKIGNSPVRRVFGTSLREHLRVTGKRIAYPLEICISSLSQYGILEEGLFRVAGSSAKVKRLKLSIDSGCFSVLIPEYRDAHVLASLLKLYLRELPEPLLTFYLHKEWMNAMQCQGAQRMETIKTIIEKLPQENRDNLSYLMQFLSKLSQYPENRMSASNIAIVLSPNLLWCKDDEETANMGNCVAVNMLIEYLIKETEAFFPGDHSKYVNLSRLFQDEEIMRWNRLNSETKPDSPKPSTRKKKSAPVPPNPMSRADSDLRNYENTKFNKNMDNMMVNAGVNTEKLVKEDSRENLSEKEQEDPDLTKSPVSDETEFIRSYKSSPTSPSYVEIHMRAESKQSLQSLPPIDNKTTTGTSNTGQPTQHYQNVAVIPMNESHVTGRQRLPSADKNYVATATKVVSPPQHHEQTATTPPNTDNKCSTATISVHRVPENIDSSQIRHKDGGNRPAKPEVPARPLSLSKKPPIDNTDSAFKKTHCSLYNVADKMHPSIIHIRKDGERERQEAETTATGEIKSDTTASNVTTIKVFKVNDESPSKSSLTVDVGSKTKSNEQLNCTEAVQAGTGAKKCDRRGSHTRARSDGGIVDFDGGPGHLHVTSVSSRNLSKPTQPPPPPPSGF